MTWKEILKEAREAAERDTKKAEAQNWVNSATESRKNYYRLKNWRERLKSGGKNRKKRDTSLDAPFSKNAAKGPKPQPQQEEVDD